MLFVFSKCSTYDGQSIGERHTYIKKCIGNPEKSTRDEVFLTISQAMQELGVDKVSLLKIDIEGYEFDEIATWKRYNPDLPEQVAIEIHHSEVLYKHYGKEVDPMDFSNLICTACSGFFFQCLYNVYVYEPNV